MELNEMDWYLDNFRWIAGGSEDSEPAPELDDESGNEPDNESDNDSIPRERFDKVYGQHKAAESKLSQYSEFGDPDALKAKLDQLSRYEDQIKDYRENQAMSEDDKNTLKTNEEIKSQLFQIFPQLKNLDRLGELDTFQADREERILDGASSHLGSILKSNEISVDTDTQGDVEDFLLSKMTEKERSAMMEGKYGVIDSVFERVKSSRLLASIMSEPSSNSEDSENDPAPNRQRSPARHKSGGQGAKKQAPGPKTLEEAANRAWEMLQNAS